MKIIIDTMPDSNGKIIYEIRNNRGKVEVLGQGNTIGDASKNAISDYYDMFADDDTLMMNRPKLNMIPVKERSKYRCHECGTTKSVKYLVRINDPRYSGENRVPMCNKCVTMYI